MKSKKKKKRVENTSNTTKTWSWAEKGSTITHYDYKNRPQRGRQAKIDCNLPWLPSLLCPVQRNFVFILLLSIFEPDFVVVVLRSSHRFQCLFHICWYSALFFFFFNLGEIWECSPSKVVNINNNNNDKNWREWKKNNKIIILKRINNRLTHAVLTNNVIRLMYAVNKKME